ncbi:tRNA glutamyl-Q synthetase [Cypionkella aquatica]|uniref:tRNA glutamyl-Q synthetase n=1 Tax=Cypionkella aquatica TaxID=1756042 RepID=A0AA37TY02_9RHOB|nr:tRNA glutamyl-Q(34) synthetase GluQRS [Cypionkella aquatica]GLS87848.1 tRNA glutamyl-Q synthetase [Cypionkella aquatica]
MAFVTRFAPSPTGPLHLGHAYSALLAHDMARAAGGVCLLRIEDIDQSRCRPQWEAQIYDDLQWLGLNWPEPVLRQSDNLAAYDRALSKLDQFCYPCRCNRADIRAALSAPQEGVLHAGPDGLIYPGTCRHRSLAETTEADAIRLDITKAMQDQSVSYCEGSTIIQADRAAMLHSVGDIILSRRDISTSYHLSVVVDDAAQGVTDVVRGMDLQEATKIHALLQRALCLPTPIYHHHRLIRDEQGKRLAKRDDARALSKYRAEGATPADIRRMVGL